MNIYEYGIWNVRHNEIHRKGFTEKEAHDWLDEWCEMDGNEEVFRLCRRPVVTEWEIVKVI